MTSMKWRRTQSWALSSIYVTENGGILLDEFMSRKTVIFNVKNSTTLIIFYFTHKLFANL